VGAPKAADEMVKEVRIAVMRCPVTRSISTPIAIEGVAREYSHRKSCG
jgi:hypothetical protein